MAFARSLSSANADMPMIGDIAGLGIALEGTLGFPTVNDRHFEVHQIYIWVFGRCHLQKSPTAQGAS